MGASDYLKGLQARFAGRALQARPFFVTERNWTIFVSYVREERTVTDLAAAHGFSAERVRQIINEVDHQLSLPRKSEHEWRQVTADSPMEDLGVSVRVLNRLHDLGCKRVEDVLRLDFKRKALGPTSRLEVVEALKRCGFAAPASAAPVSSGDLERVTEQLRDLRGRIEDNIRSWKFRIDGIEARIKRLTNARE